MWQIQIGKRCLRDVRKTPKHVRGAFQRIFLANKSVNNPFDESELGARLEKLSGTEDAYKVRIGKYRAGIFLDRATHTLKVVKFLHRREIYRYFP